MRKSFKIFILSFIAIIFIFSLTSIVFGAGADITCIKYKYPWCNEYPKNPGELVKLIYNYSLALVGVVALGVIIYGGIKYTISAGNPSEQSDATQWITGAIWGLVLLLGAVILFQTINPQIISLELTKLKGVDIKTQKTPASQQTELGIKACKDHGYNILCSIGEKDCYSVSYNIYKDGRDTNETKTVYCKI